MRSYSGRNVCLYYLMGSCKFGNVKCTYSHSKDFLGKDGWWATEEGRQTRRDEVKNAREVEKELRTLWNGLLCLPRTTSQMNGGKPGSSKGRVAIGRNKESIQSPITTTQPVVLLLSLGYADTFNSVHEHFLAALQMLYKRRQGRVPCKVLRDRTSLESLLPTRRSPRKNMQN